MNTNTGRTGNQSAGLGFIQMMDRKIQDSLEQTLVDILLAEPFFGHLAAHLLREARTDIQRIGLVVRNGGTIALGINPDYWRQLQPHTAQRYGAIKHELLHLALLHPFRADEFPDQALFNLAADLVVNQFLTPEQILPEQLTLEQLGSVSWKEQQGVAYYYECLQELLKSAAERSAEDRRKVAQHLAPDHAIQQQHSLWGESKAELSRADRAALAVNWTHRLQEIAGREQGSAFNQLSEGLRELIAPNIFARTAVRDWRRILRMFAANSRRMVLKDTIRRPSKRYGTVPGVKIRRRQRLLVALDTSGSLSSSQLADFFREIYQLWRSGAEIMVVECDDRIRNQYTYHGQTVTEVQGRGATAFDEPIALANSMAVDGLIYLTDGFGPAPDVLPRMPLLWVISREGVAVGSPGWRKLPGRKARMN